MLAQYSYQGYQEVVDLYPQQFTGKELEKIVLASEYTTNRKDFFNREQVKFKFKE